MKNNLTKMRKPVRFEHEAPNTSSSSSTHVSFENRASGDQQDRPEPVLVQNCCVGCVLRDGWTRESLHLSSVGLVSR